MMLKQPGRRELTRLVERSNDRIELAGEEIYRDMQRAVRGYAARANSILSDSILNPKTKLQVDEIVDVGEQLEAALLDAGFDELAIDLERAMQTTRQDALDYFKPFGIEPTVAGIDIDALDAVVAFRSAEFLDLADKRLVAPLRSTLIDGIVAGREREGIYDSVRGIMKERGIVTRAAKPFSDRQLETLVDDSIRRHHRQTKALKAQAIDFVVIWYQGPNDKVTSDQCRFLLTETPHGTPGMWLEKEFTADLHPAMREDPKVVGGHWGCRHTVNYVSRSFAEEQGFVSPKREVPTDKQVEKKAGKL